MEGLLQILILLLFLGSGALVARTKFAPKARLLETIIRYVLWVLLAGMGFRIGNSPELFANLATMGKLALATAFFSLVGTILALTLASFIVPGLRRKPAQVVDSVQKASIRRKFVLFIIHLKSPLSLLSFVILGLILGILIPPVGLDFGLLTGWTLNALLFFIGIQFVQSGTSLKAALVNPAAIAVPVVTIIGTLAGSLALVPLFDVSAGKAMALAGGFGWYSLSGVLISDLGDPFLGSVAFLANMMRESMALVLIPFLGRTSVPVLAVGVGGATAMDVTLPLIEQAAGPWIVPVSFLSGAILSLVVPILVPICLKLG
jgi:uncharacterized membrane protein YbjE (DUF340 family)